MEVVLSRELANRRIFPAVDIPKSATRKMELLLEPEELKKVEMLRRALLNFNSVESGMALIKQLQKYPTNKEFLAAVGEVLDAG
jgi:transcription termination factor Rho